MNAASPIEFYFTLCGAHVAEHTPSTARLLGVWRKLSSDIDATSLAPATEFCVIFSSATRSLKVSKAPIICYNNIVSSSQALLDGM
jgi:hypothetical protein